MRVPEQRLSGVQDDMVDRFHHSQVQDVQGRIKIFNATEVLGASTIAAVDDARMWLVGRASRSMSGSRPTVTSDSADDRP